MEDDGLISYFKEQDMGYAEEQATVRKQIFTFCIIGVLFALVIIAILMFVLPTYNVWRLSLSGKAKLKEAEFSRKIAIEEAKAKKESAKSLSEAEIIRAKGVAEANKIIGKSLKDNEAYLRYLWIQALSDGNSETIYVPTEANLPILEAVRGLKK